MEIAAINDVELNEEAVHAENANANEDEEKTENLDVVVKEELSYGRGHQERDDDIMFIIKRKSKIKGTRRQQAENKRIR